MSVRHLMAYLKLLETDPEVDSHVSQVAEAARLEILRLRGKVRRMRALTIATKEPAR